MIISQPALVCLESALLRLLGRESRQLPQDERQPREPQPHIAMNGGSEPRLNSATIAAATELPTQATNDTAADAPLTAAERRARAAALKGLAFSRERRFDAARAAFAVAARLDPTLDLTRTPTFWQLERAAHEAAIDAYVDAGREDDAAVLRARVRSTFRPKPLRPSPLAVAST